MIQPANSPDTVVKRASTTEDPASVRWRWVSLGTLQVGEDRNGESVETGDQERRTQQGEETLAGPGPEDVGGFTGVTGGFTGVTGGFTGVTGGFSGDVGGFTGVTGGFTGVTG